MRLHPDEIQAIAAEVVLLFQIGAKTWTEQLRQIIREELTAAKDADNRLNDQRYLVATTTPKERNQMARQQRAAEVAAQKTARKAAVAPPPATAPSLE